MNNPDVFDLEAEDLSQPWDLAVPDIYMADAFDSSGAGSCLDCESCREHFK